jgi:branched-chain amino acid transport system permease protein
MPNQCGVFHESYASDMQLRPTTWQRLRLGLILVLIVLFPLFANNRELRIANTVIIASIGAIGLNILVGYTGQISMGQGAFLAVGAYSAGLLMTYFDLPWWLAMIWPLSPPLYLASFLEFPRCASRTLPGGGDLAAQQIRLIVRSWDAIDGEINNQARELNIPNAVVSASDSMPTRKRFTSWACSCWLSWPWSAQTCSVPISDELYRHSGPDIAAEAMGVNVFLYKLLAFATSSFFVGMAGALTAVHSTNVSWERFTIAVSIEYMAMIIIGGLGSIAGAIYGAMFIKLLPELLREIGHLIAEQGWLSSGEFELYLPFVREVAFGLAIIVTLLVEPEGIVKVGATSRPIFGWPFSY